MKSQGLPINFIVIAAIAILILILVVGFVIGGGGAIQTSLTPSVARSNCDRWCADLQQEARGKTNSVIESSSNFCDNTQIVEGSEVTCDDLNIQCALTFSDGSSRYVDCTIIEETTE